MAHEKNHDYHILAPSIWPLFGALSAFVLLTGGIWYMKDHSMPWMLLIGLVMVLYTMFAWWSEVVDESHVGDHTPVVVIGLAWFWSFFKHALYPMTEGSPIVDGVWPPAGIETFDPWHLPLINTLILLCSGCLATWAHHAIAHDNDRDALKKGLCPSL